MSKPAIRLDILDAALASIDACPDAWRQSTWHCGTVACLAGHAAVAAGFYPSIADLPEVAPDTMAALGLPFDHPIFFGMNSRDALTVWRAVLAGEPVMLPGAHLAEANLVGANLRYAHLADANLAHADLTDVCLTGADLRGANLRGSDLSGADLRGANLTDACLRYAYLIDADLTGAVWETEDLRPDHAQEQS